MKNQEHGGGISGGELNSIIDKRVKEGLSKVINHYGSSLTTPSTRSRGQN